MASSRRGFLDHLLAQLTESEDTQRVADLAQHADLRFELGRLASAADKDIQYVFDLAEIFPDGRRHGAHELHRRGREIFAFLLDRIVDVEQLVQPERGAHRRHLRAVAGRTCGVIQQVVEQLDRRVLRVAPLALCVELQDLAVREAHQALDGHAGLEAALPEGLDNRTDHPPKLE